MTDTEKLQIAIDALKSIVANDPGPAYYIALDALEKITNATEENL